ncbi:MAG: hypothetical protein CME06_13310 [Gemmatimonadetes bacterium]|nr:hypothetical protein [Gemmatimonadota bacterium]
MITKVAFIAHPTRDIEAARHFYGEVIGLTQSADFDDVWSEYDTPDGQTIALDTFSPGFIDNPAPYMALESDAIEADVARISEKGARVVKEVWTNRTDDGQEICKMAMIIDPDGNPIMLHQMAANRIGK